MPFTPGGMGTSTQAAVSAPPAALGRFARSLTRVPIGAPPQYQPPPEKQENRPYQMRLMRRLGAAQGRRSRREWKPCAAPASGPSEK
jgi:hypothetical protein